MSRLTSAWVWLKRFGGWVVAGALTVLTLGLYTRRRRSTGPSPSDFDALGTAADAHRGAVAERVGEDLKEASEHRTQAEAMGVETLVGEAEVNFASDDELLERLRRRYRERREKGGAALLLLLSCAATTVHAQPFPMPHPKTAEPGFWLATPEVRDGERCLTVEPKLLLRLAHLDEALLTQDSAIAALQLQVASDAKVQRALRISLGKQTARAARAEAKLQIRWRSPWLWGGVGLAVGALAGGLLFTLGGG